MSRRSTNAEAGRALPQYRIYAIRYATMERRRSDNFVGGDPHDGPMPMDYFVWLLASEDRCILVDTGFNADAAATRQRNLLRSPIDALSRVGADVSRIDDVILTHLHYDHAGNLDRLPAARFHVQDREVEFATGRCMCHGHLRHSYSSGDICQMVRLVYSDRVVFHDGDSEVAPGVELILIGGHTRGLQSVCVHTARGWVVLASDAAHYYENMEANRPFPIVSDVAEMLAGHWALKALVASTDFIVPGHDPAVLRRYPRIEDDPLGIACLHLPPVAEQQGPDGI